jgi:hypothetical protein
MGADFLGILIAAVIVILLTRTALSTEARAERYRARAAKGLPVKVPSLPRRAPKCYCPHCDPQPPLGYRANRAAYIATHRHHG